VVDNAQVSLLTPDIAPVERYPYRRVWRAIALEIGAMLGMVVIVIGGVTVGVLRNVPSRNWGLLLILIPLGVYLWFAVRSEQRAIEPREGLLTVFLFSALLANGVGVPLVDGFFQPTQWLSDAGFFNRVFGYAFTFGVTCEFLKYVAIRYTVFPRRLRIRMDGIAYSVAASVGYATVLNIHVVFGQRQLVVADAIRLATNFISQVGFGIIMGYFIVQMVKVPRRPPYFWGAGLFLAALMHGIYIAFRSIAGGSGYGIFPQAESVRISGLAAFYGLVLLVFFVLLVALSINFLIENAEQREANLAGIKRIR
jgi:RsiW-degrading membrane proteinase PrsW (M82 family)